VIGAVTFDLDDTLYPQADYLAGAWGAVAHAGGQAGLDAGPFRAALEVIASEGSDQGGIIDRALAKMGADPALAGRLVEVFRAYRPPRLLPYPGAVDALARLRRRVPVACITDGDPAIQRAKLAALHLDRAFDAIVISDELGRARRKPHAAPYVAALRLLRTGPGAAVHVGDRPDKDVLGAGRAGMRVVRVMTGEYTDRPNPPPPWSPWRSCDSVAEACDLLLPLARRRAA
jgi:putative hydrolase of the HAD superfamily